MGGQVPRGNKRSRASGRGRWACRCRWRRWRAPRSPTGGSGGTKRPFLKLPRGNRAAGREGAARRDLVEAAEPVVAVEAGEGVVGDGRGMVDQALAKAGAGFGRGQGLRRPARGATGGRRAARGWRAAPPPPPGRRCGPDRRGPGPPAARRSATCGRGARWGRARRAARIAALRPALSPSKQRIGAGSSRHMRSSWASVTAVPLGATTSAMPARSRPITSI